MVSSLKELLNDAEFASTDDLEEKFVTSGVSWHYSWINGIWTQHQRYS